MMTGHCDGLVSDCMSISLVFGVVDRQAQEDIRTIDALAVGE